ncbi:MAG: aspartate aminotransferase family protein, partial [Nitrososphaerota archaeon]|nr:aspartate aminotransferase family protein [Nitrososphaerota archaeon]
FPDSVNFGMRVGKKALGKGLILRYDPHWIAFAPPLIIGKQEVDQMMDIFAESVRETLRDVG